MDIHVEKLHELLAPSNKNMLLDPCMTQGKVSEISDYYHCVYNGGGKRFLHRIGVCDRVLAQ